MKTICIVMTLCVGAIGLQAADETARFQERDKAWAAAVAGRDIPALEKMFADQLIYAHSTGKVESKQQYLDRLKTGAQKYDSINIEKDRVVPYGDAVVTHSILRMTGTSNGKPFNDHVMMLHVWVKQSGVWRIAAHQTTKLPE